MSGGSTQTTEQESTVPQFQQDALEKYIFSQIGNLPQLQAYLGQTLAGPSAAETAGQQQILGFAGGGGQQLANQQQNYLGSFLSGNIDDANPALRGAADAATRSVFQGLTEQALPAIRGQAIQQGGLGSSAQGIAEAQGIERASQQALDATSNIYAGAYQQGIQQSLSPNAFNLGTQPGQALGGVGAQQRGFEQAGLSDLQNNFYTQQFAPFGNLQQILALIGGQYGGGGTGTTTGEPTLWERLTGTGGII